MYRLPYECPLRPLLCSRILQLSGIQTTHCSSVCNTSDPQRTFSVMSREAWTLLARSRYDREGGGEQELGVGDMLSQHNLLPLLNNKTHTAKVKVDTIMSTTKAAYSQPTVATSHSREYEAMQIEKYLKECIIGAYRPQTTFKTHTLSLPSRASASPVPWSLLLHQ
jgi:hypothetical protein